MDQNSCEQAFMEAFDAYSDAIFRFCMVKVSNKELAEDMTQEVFMRFWQGLRDGKEMRHTRAYLYTIAHNLAKDWYKRKKAVSLDAQMESGFEPQVGATVLDDVEYAQVLRTINEMDEQDQEVLLLRFVEDFGPKDIAEILGERPNVISVRINRAMKRLQEKLHV